MDAFAEQARELAARRIERRAFLKGAAGIGVLAAMESSNMAKALIPALGGAPDPHNSGLDTIVCTMMENRSIDHYLGWMGFSIDGLQAGYSNPTALAIPDECPGGSSDDPTTYAVADPTPVPAHRLGTHCLGSDPDHGWDGSRVCFNGGAMNGFAHRSGVDAMGYYIKEDIPFIAWLAENYVTFSRYFSSVMGPTFPNRLYWISANSGHRDPARNGETKGNDIPSPNGQDPELDGHDWPCIFHQLDAAGIPWTYYHSDLATVMLFFNRVTADPGKIRFIADYFIDAAAGLLTPVVFVDPSFYVWGNDDHPAHDVMWGQRYLYDVFMALASGPQWWNPKTKKGAAFILNYDEAGGFYDHVLPPRVYDPDASDVHCEDWGRLGFRVPAIVASPFSMKGPGGGGAVHQGLFDHTSVVKFLQWRFNLGSLKDFKGADLNLGSRDIAPTILNLNEAFDFNPDNAHPDFASEPPAIPLHAEGVACSRSEIPEANGGQNPLEPVPEVPLPPLARPRTPASADGPHSEWVELAERGYFGKFDFRERAKQGVIRD